VAALNASASCGRNFYDTYVFSVNSGGRRLSLEFESRIFRWTIRFDKDHFTRSVYAPTFDAELGITGVANEPSVVWPCVYIRTPSWSSLRIRFESQFSPNDKLQITEHTV
jgi:hypothetical protein